MSSPTIFTVASFGRSGTVWLSKVLNSHPDVLAYHEGAMKHTYPRAWFEAGMMETEQWLGAIKYMAPWDVELKTYAAVGDLNSFFGFHRITGWENEFYRAGMRPRQEKIVEGTRLSFLARNPIVALESKCRLMKSNWDFYRDYSLWYGLEMIELNRDGLGEFEPEIRQSIEARIFFMLCLHLRCAVRFGYSQIYRMEDITTSLKETARACEEITGLPFDPKQIEAAHARKENVMPGAAYERNDEAIWAQWPATFQKMFSRLCADLPGRLGYREVTPVDQVVDKVVGLDCLEPSDHVPIHYPVTYTQADYKFVSRLIDLGFSPESIMDVGGAEGSWTRRMAHLFPKARFSLFEPLADHVEIFRKGLDEITSATFSVNVFKLALGNANNKVPMLLNEKAETSSCLPPVEGIDYAGCEQVLMLTLDMALRKFQIPPPTLLNIEVNGFELYVLEGAKEALATVEVLFLETWLERCHGTGTPLLAEAIIWLANQGLYLAELLEKQSTEGIQISQRAVFMRENNRYFAHFGRRRLTQ